jgi:hypothetical protein
MNRSTSLAGLATFFFVAAAPARLPASSHMDAPLITLDDAANTTDVYGFVTTGPGGAKYLTTALAVYPFEEPGIGPNKHNFDDNVLYEIHVATGRDLKEGQATFSYQFRFTTHFKNENTILQSYLGVIHDVDDAAQNLTQTYTVRKVEHQRHREMELGGGKVPPNNQGIATPEYDLDGGNGPARDGVSREEELDRYTAETLVDLKDGYRSFCGQRDDGFYADIHAIFDLLQLRAPGKGFDSQGGFNVHTIVLSIPVADLGGELQSVGVYATTSRKRVRILDRSHGPREEGSWVQVGREGNPLFCEALVALKDKDRYNQTSPSRDEELFRSYAESPELARLLNLLVINPAREPGKDLPDIETGRLDLVGIFIPDLIRVDLSTSPARLAGGGPAHPTTPDDPGFSRLGIFGGDVLLSRIQPGFGGGVIPGGWPNGRRFGDDVLDIAVTAIISNLRVSPPIIRGPAGDNVDHNDAVYNKVMPYAGTPQNGRNHTHP